MSESRLDIEELKARVGEEWQVGSFPVAADMVRRFTRAVGDTNPLWQQGTVAPPTFVLAVGAEQFMEDVMALASFSTLLMASTELEFHKTISPGDVITVVFKISGIRERRGTMGQMAFITLDGSYTNQRQELAARCRQMIIGY